MMGEYLKVNALSYFTSLPSCYFKNKCILKGTYTRLTTTVISYFLSYMQPRGRREIENRWMGCIMENEGDQKEEGQWRDNIEL